MKPAALSLWLAILSALPAMADGPALAHLTIDGRTITLTAVDPLPPEMTDGDLELRFAQHHLGFPLPPFLNIALQSDGGPWSLGAFTLERGFGEQPLAFGTAALQLSQNGPDATVFVIEGDGLAPGAQMIPVHVEITLTSP